MIKLLTDTPKTDSVPDKLKSFRLTPMFEQYLNIKAEYPDALLFYRMGDFYELFFEDAEIAARELQIALTSRNPNSEEPVSMCGVPHHAARSYMSKLLVKGYKIAVCDQMEDPKAAKGLVKRGVTRILTPGTDVDESNLEGKGNNFLAAIFWKGDSDGNGSGGLGWIDYSTGEWTGIFVRRFAELFEWALKINPRELILPESMSIPSFALDFKPRTVFVPEGAYFDLKSATERVLKAQGVQSASTLDLADKPQLMQALGAITAYLVQTQKEDLTHLAMFKVLSLNRHLIIDETAERNLEIFRRLDGGSGPGTLIHVLDKTLTPMGGRLLESVLRNPWREIQPVNDALEATACLYYADTLRSELRKALNDVYDVERLSIRIFLNRSSPKDFIALRKSLKSFPIIEGILASSGSPGDESADGQPSGIHPFIRRILDEWDNMDDLAAELESLSDNPPPVITEGDLFRSGFFKELDELNDLAEHGEGMLRKLLEREKSECGVNRLKLGYNRVFGHYFEIPANSGITLPDKFVRRQTLANSERFVTEELKELEEKMLSASSRAKELEYSLFQKLRERVAAERLRFASISAKLAELDLRQGLAEVAKYWEWCKPVLNNTLDIRIKGGRHPAVEAVQGRENFIANDLLLNDDRRVLIVTGPNMSGKSTVLRQTAIICLLAQIGSFVPAQEAEIGITDRIFTRVGASDNLSRGRSTFMVEMMETARVLRHAKTRSLVILDEIGRGTSTYDGLAVAQAVVEELATQGKGGVRTLFATHYHELTSLEGKIPGIRNINIAVKEWKGDIIFLRRLVPGPADRSYGVEVARLAGIPRNVVARAREILAELEKIGKSEKIGRHISTSGRSTLPGLFIHTRDTDSLGYGKREEEASDDEIHPLLTDIRALNLETLSPLEAFALIKRWKEIYGLSFRS